MIVLVTAVALLKDGHISQVKRPFLVDPLADSDKKTILIEGVVDDLGTEVKQDLVGKHEPGSLWVLKNLDGRGEQKPDVQCGDVPACNESLSHGRRREGSRLGRRNPG